MTVPLFDERVTLPRRRPCGMLRDRGIYVVDDPRAPRVETARQVAAHVALGGWCDALAWAARVDPLTSLRPEDPPGELVLEYDPFTIGPMVVDTPGL